MLLSIYKGGFSCRRLKILSKADELMASLPPDVAVVFVDMHAETTSEKIALGGTWMGGPRGRGYPHHVATADEHVLPHGTAYITDVGMTGPHSGVIGMDREGIIRKFINGLPARFEVASGDVQMNAVLVETDDDGPRNSEAGCEPFRSNAPPAYRLSTCAIPVDHRVSRATRLTS